MTSIPDDVMQKAREIDTDAFRAADRIALKHTVKGTFESIANSIARKIRLRTDIYIAILAERSAAKRRIEELEADATADDIEAAARGMYGSKWDSPKDDERPGEKMKDVWRKYAADAIAGFLARRALLRAKEGQ